MSTNHDNTVPATDRQESISAEAIRASVQRGTRALFVVQFLSQLLSLAVLFLLYRWIEREQFGYLGMVLPVMMIIRLVSTQSLNIASTQADHLTRQTLSNLFWVTLWLGFSSSLLAAVISPILAWAFAAPTLLPIAWALSGTAFIASWGVQHQAILERRLQIGQIAVIRLTAQTIAAIGALAAAWKGWGVWALVIQQYVELFAVALGNMAAARFVPALPRGLGGLQPYLYFGGNYFCSNLVFHLGQNMDKLLLSILFGSTATGRELVGMYTQAYNQMMKPVNVVTTPIAGIMFPALARARKHPGLYAEIVRNFFRLVALVLFPCGIGLCVVAEDAFTVLGGEKWILAGRILAALSLIVSAQGLINICGSVFASTGKTGMLMLSAMVISAILTATFVLVLQLGKDRLADKADLAIWLAWSYTLITIGIVLVPYLLFCLLANGVDPKGVLPALATAACAAIVMGLVCGLAQYGLTRLSTPPAGRLAIVVSLGVTAYALATRREIVWAYRQFVLPPEQV